MNQDAAFRQRQKEEMEKVEQRDAMARALIQQRQKEVEERRIMQKEISAVKVPL